MTVNVNQNTVWILAVLERICLGFKWLAAINVTKVVGLSATIEWPGFHTFGNLGQCWGGPPTSN